MVKEGEDQVRDLEDKEARNINHNSKKEKRIQKNEDSVRSLWDNLK